MNCNICLELINKNNNSITPCGHTFCFNCIIKAMQYNSNCPCCRAPLREVEVKAQEQEEEAQANEETNDEEAQEQETQYKYGKAIDDCYYMPVNIETFKAFYGVLDEIGTLRISYSPSLLYALIKLIEPEYDITNNLVFPIDKYRSDDGENEWAKDTIDTIKDVLFIFQRTQSIKKLIQQKILRL